jgi:DNA-directed RNA polymerase sigma subunit (sigma70/sigma32)
LVFQRRWALDTVEKALEATRRSYLELLPGPLLEALFTRLRDPETKGPTSAELAEQFGISPEKVRQTLHRMRKSFAAELFQEVGQTIESRDPREIREELRTLLGYL